MTKNIFWCFNVIVDTIIAILFSESKKLMIKNTCFRFFSIIFIMFLFSTKVISAENLNTLSEIKINTSENNIININLLFKDTYKEKAFLQKQEDGSYYVFLPNTTPVKNTKISYENIADKDKIRLTIEGKTAIKEDKNYSYTKIQTDINKNYGIKLISKVQTNNNLATYGIAFAGLIILSLLINAIGRNRKIKRPKSQTFTRYPKNFQTEFVDVSPINTTFNKIIIPKEQIKKNTPFKFADKSSFDCFNISNKKEDNNTAYEFKSMLKQTSNALNNRIATITHKHSNPITRITKEQEDTGLSIPSVADFFTPIGIEKTKTEQKFNNVELISVLNITNNKGFYLTNLEDTIALFGFVNNNVFLFNRFKDLTQINLQARFYDKNGDNDIYIVRLDSFKAMIEISDTSMKELARI